MTITITIADNVASEVLQNFAASEGWTDLTDAEVTTKLKEHLTGVIVNAAVRGGTIAAEQAAQAEAAARYTAAIAPS